MEQKYVKPTLSRILKPDGKVVMIALDHARMNGLVNGLHDQKRVIEAVIEGGADAIMTSYGNIKNFGYLMNGKVSKILRLDTGASRFTEPWESYTEWHQVFTVEDALRLGADGVITYSFPGLPVDGPTLAAIGRVAAQADKYCIPSIAEMHACKAEHVADPYSAEVVASESRIASEFGADMVKTDYTGDKESFKLVTSCCPIPVIIAGGDKAATPRDTLQIMRDAMDAGAAGPVFGRQIWQDEHIVAMTRAIVAIVHGDASVDEAMEVYRQNQ